MTRILAIAILAISTITAPARAMDAGTTMAISLVGGLLKKVGQSQNHQPPACRHPYVMDRYRRCVPVTYLPPNIPGSSGYTTRHVASVQRTTRTEHVTDPAKTHLAAFAVTNAPECIGKPAGTRYQRTVTEPGTRRVGRANYHC